MFDENKISEDSISWTLVHTTNTEIDGEMFKANLESADIPVQLLKQIDSTRNFTVGGLALVKIFVPATKIEQARAIITEIENNPLS